MKFTHVKILPLFVAFLLTSFITSAQIEREPVVMGKMDTISFSANGKSDKISGRDRLKDLNLTKEQRVKMKEMRADNQAKKAAIESNSNLSDAEKKMQLRALQKEQAQKIQSILTEEQKAKFKAGIQNNP